uniref:uS12 prolyl 3-hydroxylase n=1 Tax=Clastoptera arizonana TaxID=38151 RepID=A0A1B6C4M4_9HEMI
MTIDLEEILNPLFSDGNIAKKVKARYQKNSILSLKAPDIKIIEKPFRTMQIFNVFKNEDFLTKFITEINCIKLHEKSNDLYSISQSDDLNILPLDRCGKIFKKLINKKLWEYCSLLVGEKLKSIASMTISKYQKGDYLLCHDDKCEDRCIAFVIYLSNVEWEERDGGLLSLFNHDKNSKQPTTEEIKLLPIFNSMVLFKVSTTSYHQVTEVVGDKTRLSINGWFHSCKAIKMPKPNYLYLSGAILSAQLEDTPYINVVCKQYLLQSVVDSISKDFLQNRAIYLPSFLKADFYDGCLNELNNQLKWKLTGPPNHRNCYLPTNFDFQNASPSVFPNLCKLLSILCSPDFAEYLSHITKHRLIEDASRTETLVNIEIQRWSQKCYTLLADNDVLQSLNFIDVVLFFGVDEVSDDEGDCGGLTYVPSAKKQKTTRSSKQVNNS